MKINVIVPPSRANIDFDVTDGEGDTDVKIRGICRVTGEKPKASVSWFTDGIPLNNTAETEIFLTTSWRDLGKEISCTISHEGLKEPIIYKSKLQIRFQPRKPTLQIHEESCVRDQESMKFVCELPQNFASPAVSSYQWFSEGSLFGNQVRFNFPP